MKMTEEEARSAGRKVAENTWELKKWVETCRASHNPYFPSLEIADDAFAIIPTESFDAFMDGSRERWDELVAKQRLETDHAR